MNPKKPISPERKKQLNREQTIRRKAERRFERAEELRFFKANGTLDPKDEKELIQLEKDGY